MKKYFMKKAPKEMTEEERLEILQESNVPTHKPTRKSKFSGFSSLARDTAAKHHKDYNTPQRGASAQDIYREQQERLYGPGGNPYMKKQSNDIYDGANNDNPYARNGNAFEDDPYSRDSSCNNQSSAGSNLYERHNYRDNNPRARQVGHVADDDPYSRRYNDDDLSSGRSGGGFNYARSQRTSDCGTRAGAAAEEEDELNELPGGFTSRYGGSSSRTPSVKAGSIYSVGDELNELPSAVRQPEQGQGGSKYAAGAGSGWLDYPDEQQQLAEEEDEETVNLKQQIRSTKKESVQSTRNAMMIAAEAEAAGRNALGMLGSQGERIANTERSLNLAEQQTKIAEEGARELARLNRSIFIPNVANPFTSKRRLKEKEAKIKSEHMQEQLTRERLRQQAFDSERRVTEGLNSHGLSDTAMRHKKEMLQNSESRKKYQFEADSEDEDMENEIDMNLEGLDQAASRLKTLGLAMGHEVKTQNKRLDRITDETDRLDINVHMNASRLAGLK